MHIKTGLWAQQSYKTFDTSQSFELSNKFIYIGVSLFNKKKKKTLLIVSLHALRPTKSTSPMCHLVKAKQNESAAKTHTHPSAFGLAGWLASWLPETHPFLPLLARLNFPHHAICFSFQYVHHDTTFVWMCTNECILFFLFLLLLGRLRS